MIWQWLLIGWIVMTLTSFGFYLIGKRRGYRDGKLRARVEEPIRMRLQVLQNGGCPICGAVYRKADVVECCKRGD